MNVDPDMLKELFAATRLINVAQAAIIFLVGMLVVRVATRSISAILSNTIEPQQAELGSKVASYVMSAIVALSALRQLGFDLQVFLGAAGILTVALGFASQTSVANVISGLFIIFEKPFRPGDWVRIGAAGVSGEVLTIGFLSTRIRTADNLMVRYPNEMLMKAEITNLTRHPIRRLDLRIGVAYTQNLREFRRMLVDLARDHRLVLNEPKPTLIVESFGDTALHVVFSVWTATGNFQQLKESLLLKIKDAFDRHGITAPVSSGPTVIVQGQLAGTGQAPAAPSTT